MSRSTMGSIPDRPPIPEAAAARSPSRVMMVIGAVCASVGLVLGWTLFLLLLQRPERPGPASTGPETHRRMLLRRQAEEERARIPSAGSGAFGSAGADGALVAPGAPPLLRRPPRARAGVVSSVRPAPAAADDLNRERMEAEARETEAVAIEEQARRAREAAETEADELEERATVARTAAEEAFTAGRLTEEALEQARQAEQQATDRANAIRTEAESDEERARERAAALRRGTGPGTGGPAQDPDASTVPPTR